MSKQLRLDVAQLTDVGRKRPHNEDNMAYVIPLDEKVMAKKGALFIVADGMGGHAAGEVASEIAVDTVSKIYYQDDNEDVASSLENAIKRANALIHQRAAENMTRSGMGTTCVASVLRGNMAYVANVGDSRAYLTHQNHIKQVSQDHSWVEEQVRAGLLTREQARSHAQRNVITRSLGTQAEVEIDMFIEQLQEGDSMVLCSDGLSGMVGDEELGGIVEQYMPQESVYHLVERANENGGPDNITAIVIRVQEVGSEPAGARHPVPVGGGREVSNEDTAVIGQFPGVAVGTALRPDNGRTPSAPLRMTSGPLALKDRKPPINSSASRMRSRRSRLLLPTLLVLVLLLVALFGGGFYVFSKSGNIDQTLESVNTSLQKAQKNLDSNDPQAALIALSSAQKMLPKEPLSGAQATRNDQLRTQLTELFKQASASYNKRYGIQDLTCLSATKTTLADSAFSTVLKGSAVVQRENKKFFYALGDNHKLYLFDEQRTHLTPLTLRPEAQIELITGDNTRLVVLTSQAEQGNAPRSYSISIFEPDAQGNVQNAKAQATLDKQITQNAVPAALTAWGQDIFVALRSTTTTTNITILNYVLEPNNRFAPNPEQATAAVNQVVSMVAFPNHQLFVLDSAGNVRSVQFLKGSVQPIDVLLRASIPDPLTITSSLYSVATPVPTPAKANVTTYLAVPGASGLASGTVGNDSTPHLFILDSSHARILELKIGPGPATPKTANATVTATPSVAGAGQASGLSMSLLHHYASASDLPNAKGLVVDPKSDKGTLYVLTQDSQALSKSGVVTINLDQNTSTCPT